MPQPTIFATYKFADAPKTGDDFGVRNQELLDAVLSSNSGPARPPYAVAGTAWLDDTTSALYLFDGTNDVELVQKVPAPATATSAGRVGQVAFEAGFSYVCVATDTWERSVTATW